MVKLLVIALVDVVEFLEVVEVVVVGLLYMLYVVCVVYHVNIIFDLLSHVSLTPAHCHLSSGRLLLSLLPGQEGGLPAPPHCRLSQHEQHPSITALL